MRLIPAILLLAMLPLFPASSGWAFTTAELIAGFHRTVFGSEYGDWGRQRGAVQKFTGPVRFHVDDRSRGRRGGEVAAFIKSLPHSIRGLQVSIVSRPEEANFRVAVIDRADYQRVAGEIYAGPTSSFAPGKCLVRVISGPSGITRSDAVIVADRGEFLFRRCTVEEILQGLGPVNDSRRLRESVFNDSSRHATFTAFDRALLNLLYHPAVRAGMTKREADQILPAVLAEMAGR